MIHPCNFFFVKSYNIIGIKETKIRKERIIMEGKGLSDIFAPFFKNGNFVIEYIFLDVNYIKSDVDLWYDDKFSDFVAVKPLFSNLLGVLFPDTIPK